MGNNAKRVLEKTIKKILDQEEALSYYLTTWEEIKIQGLKKDTLNIITVISITAAVFFLVKGGYLYFSSTGKPEALDSAKKTIRNSKML